MIPHTRKYHILTVHYGESTPTKTLVEQLLSSSSPPDHIIIIDHAAEALPDVWNKKQVTVARPAQNAGYAGGINFGLGILLGEKTARDDIIIAMNNDMTIEPQTLARLKDWWQKNPEPALAGIKKGTVNLLTGRAVIGDDVQIPTSRFKIPYLHGSFLTAPFSAFLTLQGLPNLFFMYWEDVLFSHRAQQVGLPLKVIESIGITHDDSPPAEVSPDHLYYLVRNGALFLGGSSPRPWRFLWRIINPARFLYHSLRSRTPRETVICEALRDALRKRIGKRA